MSSCPPLSKFNRFSIRVLDLFLEVAETLKDYRLRDFVKLCTTNGPKALSLKVRSKLKETIHVASLRVQVRKKFHVLEIRSLKHLPGFSNHRKLKVFASKGCVCSRCNSKGLFLVKHRRQTQVLWSVVTQGIVEMNVDHIVPRSKGGTDGMYNKQPMCQTCNSDKSNSTTNLVRVKDVGVSVGDRVFVKRKKKFLHIGFVTAVKPNKVKTGCDKKSPLYQSWYSSQELYKVVQ